MKPSLETVCSVIEQLRGVDLSGANGNFQDFAVSRLLALGRPIEQLTIAEVTASIIAARRDFNSGSNQEPPAGELCSFAPDRFAQEFFNQTASALPAKTPHDESGFSSGMSFGNGGW